MTAYDFVDRLLIFLELGRWNGQRIFPRRPLTSQEKILLAVLTTTIADFRSVLCGQGRSFSATMVKADFRLFRLCQYNAFRSLKAPVSPDTVQAELVMLQSLRTMKETYPELA